MNKQFAIRCIACGHTTGYTSMITSCPQCGGEWLDPIYNLIETAAIWDTELFQRDHHMWRYWELLPVLNQENIVSLGEGWTPLLYMQNLGTMLGHRNIFIKDERQGPTASFKDRQASLAISVIKEADVKELVVASTGNVALAYSAYCARSGIKLWAFLDSNVPHEKMREVTLYGTEVIKVSSTYDNTKQVAARFARHKQLFLDKGIRSIAAREAMKTLAYETAEQLGRVRGERWAAPDWYVQAVSGGMGPIGVWRGFRELFEMGLIDRIPKLAIVQAAGCAPMVNSFEKGLAEVEAVDQPASVINVLSTGNPGPAYPYLRSLVLEHGGAFIKVEDEASFRALRVMAQLEGLSMEPAAAVACAGLIQMMQQRLIQPDETVVVNASGHAFPIEKQILEAESIKGHIRVQNLERHEVEESFSPGGLRQEGLMAALERLDERVENVVIVEDEPDARRLLRRILQYKRRYKIYEANDGASGIDLIRRLKPDLILLDLMMPEVDGFSVLDNIKLDKKLREIPVIVITAKDLSREDYRRLSGQVESLLQKGEFMEEELFNSLGDLLS